MADELEWHDLRSTNVKRVAFDAAAQELLVEYTSGTYAYPGQSEATLQDLIDAASPGSYAARWLRNQPARKIS